MKRPPFLPFVSGLTGILFLAVFWTTVAQAGSTKTLTLDVACNLGTAGINQPRSPNWELGDPLPPPRATVVIVNGNIYPEGTLTSDGTDFDPIGTWRCHFASLSAFTLFGGKLGDPDPDDPSLAGAVTYYFQLNPTGYDPEESMIMVQGLNSHFAPGLRQRVHAVVGGTGRYAGATGEVLEEVLRQNSSGCFDMRFHFRIRGVRHRHYRHWYKDDD
jgi:hypothetical protein